MDRNSIEEQYKWDLRQVFESNNEFENTYQEVQNKIDAMKLVARKKSVRCVSGTLFMNVV